MPHGSRKLNNLDLAQPWPGHLNGSRIQEIQYHLNTPAAVCHDQEPLDYYRYNTADLVSILLERHPGLEKIRDRQGIEQLAIDLNLRSATWIPSIYDADLLIHSEKRSEHVCKYQDHGLIGVYYWSHAVIARDWFRYAQYDPVLKQKSDPVYDFLVYNRSWSGTREYRLKFAELLIDHNLVECCNIKFNSVDLGCHYREHRYVNDSMKCNRNDLEQHFQPNTVDSTASADYENRDYVTSGIEVVLETLFDDHRLHLTEKILRPIACGKPFMLASTVGSLEYLRHYGFQTFNGLIDESYDRESDPRQRLAMIVDEMSRINKLDKHQKSKLFSQCHNIALHNQQRFFSQEFMQEITTEYQLNVEAALLQCRSQTLAVATQRLFSLWSRAFPVESDEYQILTRSMPGLSF